MTSGARTTRATDTPGDASAFAIGLLLRRAHDRAAAELVEAVRPLGLELRHFAVMITLSAEGPQSQSALVRLTDGDKATMGRVVDDLERAGIVERRPVPGDRRVRTVALTEHGAEVFDRAHELAAPITTALTGHLAPGEREQLIELLTRFTYPTA